MISDNIADVKSNIAEAARGVGRDPAEIRLIAVSKTVDARQIAEACDCGQNLFGENRVQEALEKIDLLKRKGIDWHLIGHLQKNKVKQIIGQFDLVHSIDSLRLGQRLSHAAEEAGQKQRVLVQVNTSGEETKGGFAGRVVNDDLRSILSLQGLEVRGLMTMAPFTDDEGVIRSTFRALRELNDDLKGIDGYVGGELSMGMTNDFEIAIEEGSTMIRLGTALFGGRTA